MTPLEIIAKAIAQDTSRLSRGIKRRQAMAETISKGLLPTGPRADWLRQSAFEVLGVLRAQAKAFNDNNRDDKISNHDLNDVLITTLSWIGTKQ